ncbi:MAG TPA: hypothetical protein VMZ51_02930 [Acidimicrobiales bacterium]|nr:hypothetical protein [Acidimicrobiales bacterium]
MSRRPRRFFTTSGTPTSRWREARAADTAGWVTTSRSAAFRTEPAAATARKVRGCPSVTLRA